MVIGMNDKERELLLADRDRAEAYWKYIAERYKKQRDEARKELEAGTYTAKPSHAEAIKRADVLERALVRISKEAEVLWEPMGGMPVYPELTDLCDAILDSREVLVDQSEAER
jgi:hypothetical protein